MIRQAAILCGCRGTRLGAVTADIPNPLLAVDGIPFLDSWDNRLAVSRKRRGLEWYNYLVSA